MSTFKLSIATALIVVLSTSSVYANLNYYTQQTEMEAKAHDISQHNAQHGIKNESRFSSLETQLSLHEGRH